MFHIYGCFSILGMPVSRNCAFGALLLVWLCWPPLLIEAQITNPAEVQALGDVKNSLIDVNGNLSNWNRGDPCTANWTGVLCFNTTMDDGYLHVRELQLLSMNLSGSLSPSLGRFSHLEILDFMWNKISGSIPKEIGDIKSLKLLLLNGNQLTGPLPEELGNLPVLDRIQIDQNKISGPLPKSFASLNKTKHFHMNNNSISGQIPPELSRLPNLVHFLLDNNNLSGYLPPEFSELPKLLILQLDNNNFDGGTIPDSYGNMTKLLKLSLRNCNLQGPMPDLSRIPNLGYLDLGSNHLNGSIPSGKLSENITTIDLSDNNLTGTIPNYFSGLPRLQKLSLANNSLNGSVPSTIWQNRTGSGSESLSLDFENNKFSDISGNTSLPQNFTLWLQGNPACNNSTLGQFCGKSNDGPEIQNPANSSTSCEIQSCPPPYEYSPTSPTRCFCAVPLIIEYRLKSPGFWDFVPYRNMFDEYLSSGLKLYLYQLYLEHFEWEEGPRIKMQLKFFPVFDVKNSSSSDVFNTTEVLRILNMFTGWNIPDNDTFGPYELLGINLLGPYREAQVVENYLEIHLMWAGKETCCIPFQGTYGPLISAISATPDFEPTVSNTPPSSKKDRTGPIVGIVIGIGAASFLLTFVIFFVIRRKRRQTSYQNEELLGIDARPYTFSYSELKAATDDFHPTNKLGEGGFGPVYKGQLNDGRVIAVKQLSVASNQGKSQFVAEIATISAVQHRNLVKLCGCCIEGDHRLLVYEYLENKSLDQALFGKGLILNWSTRFDICLGVAKGLAYLHQESRVRIVHRDVKASNILLDSDLIPKISDFGLAKLYDDKKTHISTRVAGTIGYLAPEYAMRGHLTEKADVFAFGVVALEIISGRPNSDSSLEEDKMYLLEWAWHLHENNREVELVDSILTEFKEEELQRAVGVALLCTQTSPLLRPSMSRVVAMLSGDIEVSSITTRPGYLTDWKFDDKISFMSGNATIGDGSSQDNLTLVSNSTITGPENSPKMVTKPMLHDIIGEGR